MDRRDLLALMAGAGLAGLACRGEKDNPTVEAARTGAPYQFKALGPHEAATVSVVGDCIIPATDTPGATDAGVPEFIDVIVGEWYQPAEREQFLAGLADLDRRSAPSGGRFVELNAKQQLAVLTQVESEALAARAADPKAPSSFWVRLKSLTLYGYYTSAAGALQELNRPIIPGRFDGCEHLPAARPGAL